MMTTAGTSNAERYDAIMEKLMAIEQRMAERQHYDEMVKDHDKFINGNGKPGAKSQLAVMNWINGILFVAILIDIITRLTG
jgi:hypothetical protein